MLNRTALYARDLLRIALDLLEDEQSPNAVAMISSAIEVLEHKPEPSAHRAARRDFAYTRATGSHCRSCA